MYEAAPDMRSLKIEGLEEPIANGFFAVEKLIGAPQAAASTLQQPAFIGSDGMD